MHKKQFDQPRKSAEDFQYQPENQKPTPADIESEHSFQDYIGVDVQAQMPKPQQNSVEALCQKAHNGEIPTANRYENDDNYTRINPIGKPQGFTLNDIPLNKNGQIESWSNIPLLLSNLFHPEIARDRNGNLVIYERVRPHDHDQKKHEKGPESANA